MFVNKNSYFCYIFSLRMKFLLYKKALFISSAKLQLVYAFTVNSTKLTFSACNPLEVSISLKFTVSPSFKVL